MKKLTLAICVLSFISMCSCEKNNCQTFLQGSWTVTHALDTTLTVDSVIFYKGDSIRESYRNHTDTTFNHYYSSYFITNNCDEIDFNGENTWTPYSTSLRYQILLITPHDFRYRSKADSTCATCITTLHR